MKFRFIPIMLLIILLATPTYAQLTYLRTYYGNNVKFTNQRDTGEYGGVSCLPTSIKMILDYQGIEAESVSDMFHNMEGDSEGVYTGNAIEYLKKLDTVNIYFQYFADKNGLKIPIDKNVPYILAVNPYLISNQGEIVEPSLKEKIGKPYTSSGNAVHAIAVIGYLEIGDALYLEVLDPATRERHFYEAENVVKASIRNWVIAIQKVEVVDDAN